MKALRIPLLLCLLLTLQPVWSEDPEDPTDTAAPVAPPPQTVEKLPLPPGLKDGDSVILRIGNRRVRAEIANTPEGREHGLMQRDFLCDSCGMLFIFNKAEEYSFWMKDTLLPLSIAFIAADGSILNIEEMQPNTFDTHVSQGAALYALEMNSGWFTRNSIAPSDKIQNVKRAP